MKQDSAVPNHKIVTARRSDTASTAAGGAAWLTQDFVAKAATIGVIAGGVALFEAALIPGLAIGAAAVLAPKPLSKLGRRLRPLLGSAARRRTLPGAKAPPAAASGLAFRRTLAKTVTFRIIVTSLDVTWNYLVLGELAAAVSLSAISFVVGPVFYFVHEATWNYSGLSVSRKAGPNGAAANLSPDAEAPLVGLGGFTINRALAKTITFRTIATTMDFATNYVVVRDLSQAAALTAFGFVVGPFVYLGHEMAWDHFGAPSERLLDQPTKPARAAARLLKGAA